MIKRYTLDPGMLALVAHEDGEVVDYNDHLAAIQAAKVEAVREFGEWLRGEINWDVRHYCEKHIEQLNKEKGDE